MGLIACYIEIARVKVK